MSIQVRIANGDLVEFPDGTPHSVIQNALARHYGGHGTTQDFAAPGSQNRIPSPAQNPVLAGYQPQKTYHLRSPSGQMIDVRASSPEDAIAQAQHMSAQAGPNRDPMPNAGASHIPSPSQNPVMAGMHAAPHPQSEDLWRSALGGLTQGVNATGGAVAGAHEAEDRLAERGAQAVAAMTGQSYVPGSGTEVMQRFQNPAKGAAYLAQALNEATGTRLGPKAIEGGIHAIGNVGAPAAVAWSKVRPQDVENATADLARALAGDRGAAAVRDVEDYQPQTLSGHVAHTVASMAPAAIAPGSMAQRALMVAAPAAGSLGAEGLARAAGGNDQDVSDAQLLGSLLGGGLRHGMVRPTEGAIASMGSALGDAARGPMDLGTINPAMAGKVVKPSEYAAAIDLIGKNVGRGTAGAAQGSPLDRVAAMGQGARLGDLPELQGVAGAVSRVPSSGAQQLAQALQQRQQGVLNPTTGTYDALPSNVRIAQAFRDGMGVGDDTALSTADAISSAQKQQAAASYAKAYAADPVDVSTFSNIQGPRFQAMYDRARAISQDELVPQDDGSHKLQPLPEVMPGQLDWRTLDLMKQSADDMVGEGARQGIGANAQNAVRGFRDMFRDQLDQLNPDYADARSAYAGNAAMLGAIDAGKRFMAENPEGAAATFQGLSPSEQYGFRVGAVQSLGDRLGGTNTTNNAATAAGLLKPAQLGRFQAIFPDQQSYADFVNTLQNEKQFTDTNNAVNSGSKTAGNMAQDADAGEPPNLLEAGAGAWRAAHGELDGVMESASNLAKFIPFFGKMLGKGAKAGGKMTEGQANAAGAILSAPDAASNPTLRDSLSQAWDDQDAAQAAQQPVTPEEKMVAAAIAGDQAARGRVMSFGAKLAAPVVLAQPQDQQQGAVPADLAGLF